MNKELKRIVWPFYVFFKLLIRLNIWKTIYINYKTQPLNVALRIPIFVYGKLKIHSLQGEIIIDAPIKTGMIKIGYRYIDLVPLSYLPSQILIIGKLKFKGYAIFSGGVSLSVNDGIMIIGNCCTIGGGSIIKCLSEISIGDNSRITYGCTIFDCNMHYIKEINTGIIRNNRAPIKIGKNCWINAKTYIAKGTCVPDYSITAGNSFLNKDYTPQGTNLFLVGTPAKPLDIKVQRIFNTLEENRLTEYFKRNTGKGETNCEKGIFNDENNFPTNIPY